MSTPDENEGDVEMTDENEQRTAKNLEKLDDTAEEEPVSDRKMRG